MIDGKVVAFEPRLGLPACTTPTTTARLTATRTLCHAWHTGSGEHSYDTRLETDSAGNFYFFKTGDTHLPCMVRLDARQPDGKKVEVFSTGFRHPIGLGVSPTDMVTGADQEGNWMPVTRLDIYKRGGFYGDMRHIIDRWHRPPTIARCVAAQVGR
ncbi:MAG: hypothetical protein U0840_27415 [Gemmataceae bacterium]